MTTVRKISVREEVYRLLQELQQHYGATSISDTILILAENARTCEMLEEKLAKLDELEAELHKLYLAVTKLLEELGKR